MQQFYAMAERVVSRCPVGETRFSETSPWLEDDEFPRSIDIVTALTEGQLAGRTYAVWLPIAGAMYRNEDYRSEVIKRTQDAWRMRAMGSLVPMHVLTRPKGKLPA